MRIQFVGFVVTYDSHVCDFVTFRDLIPADEFYRLSAFDILISVAQSSEFIAHAALPSDFVFRTF